MLHASPSRLADNAPGAKNSAGRRGSEVSRNGFLLVGSSQRKGLVSQWTGLESSQMSRAADAFLTDAKQLFTRSSEVAFF